MISGLSGTLSRAVETAMRDAASRVILPRFRHLSGGDIIEKAADDLVTIADRESEAFLAERLGALLPEAAIIGEEAAFVDPSVLESITDDLCWIIDPLDGTYNFANGRAPFGVLIALAEHGRALAGWIFDPLQNRMCHAFAGGSAFVDGEQITARTSGSPLPIAAISTLFMTPEESEQVMTQIAPFYRLVDIPRCAAEQYPRLALGENDVSIFTRTLPWDHAAGALWLNEAGGVAARLDGSVYQPGAWNSPGMIAASNKVLFDSLCQRMNGMTAQK